MFRSSAVVRESQPSKSSIAGLVDQIAMLNLLETAELVQQLKVYFSRIS